MGYLRLNRVGAGPRARLGRFPHGANQSGRARGPAPTDLGRVRPTVAGTTAAATGQLDAAVSAWASGSGRPSAAARGRSFAISPAKEATEIDALSAGSSPASAWTSRTRPSAPAASAP